VSKAAVKPSHHSTPWEDGRGVKLHHHLHVELILRMRRAINSIPICFITRYSDNNPPHGVQLPLTTVKLQYQMEANLNTARFGGGGGLPSGVSEILFQQKLREGTENNHVVLQSVLRQGYELDTSKFSVWATYLVGQDVGVL